MSDLVEFLRAQLAEDERVAKAATSAIKIDEWDAIGPEGDDDAATMSWLVLRVCGMGGYVGSREVMQHVALWDPARVLAEVKAKRAMVKAHDQCGPDSGICAESGRGGAGPDCDQRGCGTLMIIALPYADRDGWDEAWRYLW